MHVGTKKSHISATNTKCIQCLTFFRTLFVSPNKISAMERVGGMSGLKTVEGKYKKFHCWCSAVSIHPCLKIYQPMKCNPTWLRTMVSLLFPSSFSHNIIGERKAWRHGPEESLIGFSKYLVLFGVRPKIGAIIVWLNYFKTYVIFITKYASELLTWCKLEPILAQLTHPAK